MSSKDARVGLAAVLAAGSLVASALPAGADSAPRPAPAAAVVARAGEPTSLWVWQWDSAAGLVDLASAQGIDTLYLFVGEARGDERRRLDRVAALAGPAGIELWALAGEPRWALQPDDAVRWQQRALATGLFVGTHLDVEPYSLEQWDTDRDRVVRGYLRMLERLQAADERPLRADVPYWLGTIDAPGGTLADRVLEIVEGVTVMSYRDTATGPNSLSVVAADMIARGDDAGVPIELGVETNPLGGCKHCTFAEEGVDAMWSVIDEVDAIMAGHQSYAGFAVHDRTGFAALLDARQ